jgi:signal peptidase I
MSVHSDGNGNGNGNGGPPAVVEAERRDATGAPAPASPADGRRRALARARATAAVRHALGLDERRRGRRNPPQTAAQPRSLEVASRHRRHRSLLATVAALIGVAAVAVVLIQAFVVQPFSVPTDAMSPTLQPGDRILVLKWGLLEGPVHRGDIVVIHPPRTLPCTVVGARSRDLVLRVVAMPGEVISSVGSTVLVDGRPLRESGWYDRRFGEVGSTPVPSTRLQAGRYFVMADNRSDACDSRLFGAISKSSIVGTGVAVVSRHGHLFLATL